MSRVILLLFITRTSHRRRTISSVIRNRENLTEHHTSLYRTGAVSSIRLAVQRVKEEYRYRRFQIKMLDEESRRSGRLETTRRADVGTIQREKRQKYFCHRDRIQSANAAASFSFIALRPTTGRTGTIFFIIITFFLRFIPRVDFLPRASFVTYPWFYIIA